MALIAVIAALSVLAADLPVPHETPQFVARAIIARDSAIQSLRNNDMVDTHIAHSMRHYLDGLVHLKLPLDHIITAMLLPLQEVLRDRECFAQKKTCKDGSSSSEQIRAYISIAIKSRDHAANRGRTPTYCETGFNAGHSAAVFLMLGYRVHSFDIAYNLYTPACAQNYEMIFPDTFIFHKGDSKYTLKAFAEQDEKCDVISIDGLHTYTAVTDDITNFAHVAAQQNTLLVDDTSKAYMSGDLQRAIDDHTAATKLTCVELKPRTTMRRKNVPNGWCVATITPHGVKNTCTQHRDALANCLSSTQKKCRTLAKNLQTCMTQQRE